MKRVSILDGSRVLAVLLLTGLLAGCRGSVLNPKSDLELRLDAAKQETVAADRDKSLASIATDAAEEDDYRLTLQALAAIHDAKLRDLTAEESAVRLVKSSDRADANKLAMTIKDPQVRTRTLRRLADNDVGVANPTTTSDNPLGLPEPATRPATLPATRPDNGARH